MVDAAGARAVEVQAAAGSLRVEGKAGLRQVQVTGTARASSQQFLNQIKLIAERRGDVIFIKADIPDHGWNSGYRDNYSAALDLVIQVPQGRRITVVGPRRLAFQQQHLQATDCECRDRLECRRKNSRSQTIRFGVDDAERQRVAQIA